MTEPTRRPLVLVADDEEGWQDLIRDSVEKIGARVIVAGNVQEACQEAAQHGPKSDDPLDLVILDMWMPLDAGPIPPTQEAQVEKDEREKEGGIAFLRSYRLVECPVIVFTQWPSFTNCVRAAQEGAWAYVSKKEIEDEELESGLQGLENLCKGFLAQSSGTDTAPTADGRPFRQSVPSREWLEQNYEWLRTQCGGKWAALVNASVIEQIDLPKLEKEGVAVIWGDSYEIVREMVVSHPAVLSQSPEIVFVA